VSLEFAELASTKQIATAAAALEYNGIRPLLAATVADARGLVVPSSWTAPEYTQTPRRPPAIGVGLDDSERSGRSPALRMLLTMAGLPQREIRPLAAAPDTSVGIGPADRRRIAVIASAAAASWAPLVSRAGNVILVIGASKIVPDVQQPGCGSSTILLPARVCRAPASLTECPAEWKTSSSSTRRVTSAGSPRSSHERLGFIAAAAVRRVISSNRGPSGSSKYSPRRVVVVMIVPGRLLPGSAHYVSPGRMRPKAASNSSSPENA